MAPRGAGIVAILLLAGACSGSEPAARVADLCQDLVHLEATVGLLAAPPSTARVGQVREALEKLAPTSAVLGESLVADRLQADFFGAQDGYRAAIDGVGDDELIGPARLEVSGPARRLAASYGAILGSLRCTQILQTPSI
jgi:hypothetical protein